MAVVVLKGIAFIAAPIVGSLLAFAATALYVVIGASMGTRLLASARPAVTF